jgi:hypothetical protein
MTAISNKIKDIFLGPITEISFPNGMETETRQGGLLDQFTQWLFNDENLNRGDFMTQVSEFAGNALSATIQTFSNLLETSQPLIDAISNGFSSLFTMAYNALAGVIGIPETQTLGEWINTIWSNIQTTMTTVTASITSAVDLIRQAFNLGEGGSLGDWISNTLTTLTTWKDEQITSLRRLIGMQGDESFGSFVTRIIGEIQTGIQTQINETIASLRTLIGMEGDESFGEFVSRLTSEIQTSIERQIQETIDLVDSNLKNFLGMTAGQTFESYITDMIDTLTTTIIDILENRIPALIEAAIQGARSALGGGTATAESIAAGETGIGTLADQGVLTGTYQGLLGFGDIDRERFLSEAEGGIVEGLNRMFGNMLGLGLEDWLEQKLTTLNAADIRGDQAREEVMRGLQSYIDQNYAGSERETMQRYLDTTIRETLDGIEGYRQGTNGFKNFGGGTLARLHGAEAVVPRNTPAGELLQAFYDMQNTNQPAPAPATTPSYNQSELITRIDQLNSIMSQVAAILVDQRDIQSKTMRSIKGMGTDLFRGAA